MGNKLNYDFRQATAHFLKQQASSSSSSMFSQPSSGQSSRVPSASAPPQEQIEAVWARLKQAFPDLTIKQFITLFINAAAGRPGQHPTQSASSPSLPGRDSWGIASTDSLGLTSTVGFDSDGPASRGLTKAQVEQVLDKVQGALSRNDFAAAQGWLDRLNQALLAMGNRTVSTLADLPSDATLQKRREDDALQKSRDYDSSWDSFKDALWLSHDVHPASAASAATLRKGLLDIESSQHQQPDPVMGDFATQVALRSQYSGHAPDFGAAQQHDEVIRLRQSLSLTKSLRAKAGV